MSAGSRRWVARRSTGSWSIAAALLLLATGASSFAQISPGPLSRPHQGLDGSLSCTKCHGGGAAGLRERCLGCHEELAWLAARKKGLHAAKNWDDCAKCHAEHGGRDHALVRFEQGRAELLDHRETGWPLEGKHASLKCQDCHTPRRQVAEVAELARRRGRKLVYIGLVRDCAACHQDVHGGTLGPQCGSCHGARAWKPAPRFQHAKTAFPLLGKHADTPCEKCHRAAAASAPGARASTTTPRLFRPLRHDQCSDCHADPHSARLGADCARCHDAASFRRVADGAFGHDRTRYPLRGKHREVKCEACHRQTGARAAAMRPLHARCGDCHNDAHGGQLARRPDGGECASCHVVDGWKPSTFTAADHARLRLALAGRHVEIACAACHGPGGRGLRPGVRPEALGVARVALSAVDGACAACHVDPHGGRFSAGGARAKKDDCLSCHDLRAFRPSTMDADTHRGFGFPIEGAHRDLRCEKCHKEIRATPLAATLVAVKAQISLPFTGGGAGCAPCHQTPHGDQFAARRDGGACEGCHAEDTFRPAKRFDHDRHSRFPLMRAHGLTPCNRCHDSKPTADGRLAVVYRPVSLDCKGCHREKLAQKAVSSGEPGSRKAPKPAAETRKRP